MERFRPATESDLAAVLALMRRYYAEDGYRFGETEARDVVRALVRDESLGRLWVALEAGRVVGYLAVTLGFSLEYGGRDAFVDELFIADGERGRGLGRAALQLTEAWCRGRGVRALHLEVERHREPARRLYERAGFAGHDRHLMTKRLDGPTD